jgi:S-disulfanyl-L-cysteine oxidoreductase SoxD
MNSRMNGFGSFLVLAIVAGCATAAPPSSTTAPAPGSSTPAAGAPGGAVARDVNAGVYTAAQATRGQQVFQAHCATCHTIADFTGTNFQQAWSGRPLGDFHGVIATMMPQTAPGSLTPQQYSDVVAYVLRVNNYPTGTAELPTGAQAINAIQMVPAR